MARILLVRHGQSEWNAEGRWQGRADVALSDLGRAQARAAAGRLGGFDLIVSSTLVRASETANIIADHLGIGPVIAAPELVERSAGEWSGLTRPEIEHGWPGYLADNRRPQSYETDDEFWPRVKAGLGRVYDELADPEGQALVVAHGGVIYVLETKAGRQAGRIANLGALWLEIDEQRRITIGERVLLIDEQALRSAQSSDIL